MIPEKIITSAEVGGYFGRPCFIAEDQDQFGAKALPLEQNLDLQVTLLLNRVAALEESHNRLCQNWVIRLLLWLDSIKIY